MLLVAIIIHCASDGKEGRQGELLKQENVSVKIKFEFEETPQKEYGNNV